MRLLFTCLPEHGHFHPMVPLAQAAAAAGHQVAFATAGQFCPKVEQAGFCAFPAGLTLDEQLEQAARRFPEEAGIPPGPDRFVNYVPKMLAGVAAPARAADLGPLVERWKPDLVVHGEAELGGVVVATAAGLPYADFSVGILRPFAMARLAAETLAPVCREWGVELGPLAGLYRYLYLDICPPSLQAPHISQVPVAHPLRPGMFDREGAAEAPPPWLASLGDRPGVYATFGTVFNERQEVFALVLDALEDVGLEVVATVGSDGDPARLGTRPDHVRVERYVPQSMVLPLVDLVVCHGGSGTMLAALAHGLPLLLLPQGANQFHNAAACVAAGAGRQLLPGEVTLGAVCREVRLLLEQPRYREAAQRICRERDRMPEPHEGVRLLERLASERQPLPRGPGRWAPPGPDPAYSDGGR